MVAAPNRLTGITYPDNTTAGFGYDSRGRRISATDQNNKTTFYNYDDADRLVSVQDPALNLTQYAYDNENNLTTITDANHNPTTMHYDAFGRVLKTDFPSTLSESYLYDAVGNLTSKTDRKNQTIQYVYDAAGGRPFQGFDFSSQNGISGAVPSAPLRAGSCALCKGGSDTADTIGFTMSPSGSGTAAPIVCTVSRVPGIGECPCSAGGFRLRAERLKTVVPGSNYSRPCKKRKDGAPEILIVEWRSKALEGSATRPLCTVLSVELYSFAAALQCSAQEARRFSDLRPRIRHALRGHSLFAAPA